MYLKEHKQYKNQVRENSSSFHHIKLEQNAVFNFGSKDEYVFIFVLEGTIELRCFCNEKYCVKSNEMLSLGYGFDYSGRCLSDVKFVILMFDYLTIECDNLSLMELKNYVADADICFRSLPIVPVMHVFLCQVVSYLENGMCCGHLQDIKMSEWYYILRAFYTEEETAMFLTPLMEEKNYFVSTIKEKYHFGISTVKELADVCNMSPKTLIRKFKKHFKDTPKQWMLKQQKQHIASEILRSKDKMEVIADRLGFSSGSHFTSYCKKNFDRSPKEMQRRGQIEKN